MQVMAAKMRLQMEADKVAAEQQMWAKRADAAARGQAADDLVRAAIRRRRASQVVAMRVR